MYFSEFSKTSSNEDIVKMLIDAGADLNIQTRDGWTALMLSAERSKKTSTENTVKMLIDAGANLNIQNRDGLTSLMGSSKNSNTTSTENTVKMLIDAGAELNLQDRLGINALIYASGFSKNYSTENTVKMLVEAGADLSITDKNGKTAYDKMIQYNPTSPIIHLLNPEIPQETYRVNITKTVTFEDPIMLTEEEINIEDYLFESRDNIVFVYNKNSYFFTTRHIINSQKNDSTIFPCITSDTMRQENIMSNKPLYDLKKIGFIYGFPCDFNKFFINPDCQVFAIVNTNETYPSFVSDDVLNRGGSYVSGLHCQAGQESRISYLHVAVPSTRDNPDTIQMGGIRTLKDIENFEGKVKRKKSKSMKKSKGKKKTIRKRGKTNKRKHTKTRKYKGKRR